MFSKEKIILAYTIEKCVLCGVEHKRQFHDGDFIFAEASKCNSCAGIMKIEKIFGEFVDQ
jgi:hypothetical protein